MQEHLSIEELILDDSFSNYCFQSNEEDVLFWEAYLEVNPSQREKIREARQIVLGLRAALQQVYNIDNYQLPLEDTDVIVQKEKSFFSNSLVKKIFRYVAAVAAVLLIVIGVKNYHNVVNRFWADNNSKSTAKTKEQQVFRTVNGERKSFRLPDSTTIRLNVGSTLRLAEGFGISNRTVYLSGEALFDVTHNENLPFIVRINNYDVKVLGTIFNVRAYPGEKVSETALVKGKVQIIKDDGGDLTLVPNQKVVFNRIGEVLPATNEDSTHIKTLTTQKIVPVSISPIDGAVLETAWTQDRLEIVNESFGAMEQMLERWYNVQIVFADKEVSQYTFTATFEKESILQVLEALQFTYPFNYKIEEGKITISK
jgi:transmembrane sensor